MARIFMRLDRLDEEQLGNDGDVVRQRLLAVGERVVPVDAERRAVDTRVELEPDPLAAIGVGQRRGDGAGDIGGLSDALEREVTLDLDRLAVEADVLRGEADLREPLGVEEIGDWR